MVTFEDRYMEAVIEAQKLKLAKADPTAAALFPEAVHNIHQLLYSLPGESSPISEAQGESDAFWAKLQASAKRREAEIQKRSHGYEEGDREYKVGIERARMAWEHAVRFLEFLIGLGHKYNLFPRMGRIERGGGETPSYGGVTE